MSQYEATYYGSGSGGGYMPGSPFSQGGSPSGRKGELPHSLRPLTILQLSKASQFHTDSEWKLDDIEIGQVTLVGQVMSSQKQATNHVYVFDDGTGRIEGRKWISDSVGEDGHAEQENFDLKYVRVVGGLKSFGKKRYLNINHIRAVADPHEVYFHILDAITASLVLERGYPSSKTPSTSTKMDVSSGTAAYSAAQPLEVAKSGYAHLPDMQRRMVEFILRHSDLAEGVHVSQMVKEVASPSEAKQFSESLDALMDEGTIYTTVDDSHFRVS